MCRLFIVILAEAAPLAFELPHPSLIDSAARPDEAELALTVADETGLSVFAGRCDSKARP